MELPGGSQFDDEDDAQETNLIEHIEQVREIFKQIDPSGTRGLDYAEFRTVLTNILQIDFEDGETEQLDEILADLDPEGTGYIQFAALHKQWTQQAQEDDMEEQFEFLDNLQSNFDDDQAFYAEPQFGQDAFEEPANVDQP